MSDLHAVPYDRSTQRDVARRWEDVVEGRLLRSPARPIVRDSWLRSMRADVRADLPKAPVVLSDVSLRTAQERADWVPLALRAAQHLSDAFSNGHILSLFDAEGRMLSCDGDPAVLEGLAEINFRPGGLWTEDAVGTNGPGTAIATGRAVHIVGAEHFCEAWHGWHCAAVPIADVGTNDLLGVIDISGFSRNAHPHTLQLAVALATSVRELLTAREMEQRCAILLRFAQLNTRYATDPLIAVDRHGHVLHATESAPAGLRPGTDTPRALRDAIAAHVRTFSAQLSGSSATDVFLSLGHDIGLAAMSFPVVEQGRVVGACLLLRSRATLVDALPEARIVDARIADARTGSQPPRVASESRAVTPPTAFAALAARETRYTLRDIVGASPRMTEAVRLASAAASNTLPVFLAGESGTGKEVFAQTIHDASARRSRPFVAVNCAAIPRELIEAELFGYVGGAFTGARREGSYGKFRAAEGGTIFLDEVSEMPYSAQAALLRVLQEQEISAVGSSEVHSINVRVIAATNRDAVESVRSGVLRPDLYYRLNVLSIELPALRDRRDDIPALAQHLLQQASVELARPGLTFADGVVEVLAQQEWPGNVRELKNLVRRIASLAPADVITRDLLPVAMTGTTRRGDMLTASAGSAMVDDERARTIDAMTSARTMHDAAQRLGINRSTLYRRLERYGLKAERLLSAQ
jgi:transcriptional regulator of acetoin/glycerol metabolism